MLVLTRLLLLLFALVRMHVADVASDGVTATTEAHTSVSPAVQMVEAINAERVANGKAPYACDARLEAAGNLRVNDMLTLDYFGHVSPDGLDFVAALKREGVVYMWAGENLAVMTPDDAVSHAMELFMASPGHRANILDSDFNRVGVGFGVRYDGAYMFAVIFAGIE